MIMIQVVLELRPLVQWLLIAEWRDLELVTEIIDIAMPSWSLIIIYAFGDIFQLANGSQALHNHGISFATFPAGFLRNPMGKPAWKVTTHWNKSRWNKCCSPAILHLCHIVHSHCSWATQCLNTPCILVHFPILFTTWQQPLACQSSWDI